jgi:hypothetical protein
MRFDWTIDVVDIFKVVALILVLFALLFFVAEGWGLSGGWTPSVLTPVNFVPIIPAISVFLAAGWFRWSNVAAFGSILVGACLLSILAFLLSWARPPLGQHRDAGLLVELFACLVLVPAAAIPAFWLLRRRP